MNQASLLGSCSEPDGEGCAYDGAEMDAGAFLVAGGDGAEAVGQPCHVAMTRLSDQWRGPAIRTDKPANAYPAALHLASVLILARW